MNPTLTRLVLICCSLTPCVSTANAEDEQVSERQLSALPGGTANPLGHLELNSFDTDTDLECEKGSIVVPENRQADSSRNIELQFYRFNAREPSDLAPVFVLPGGPGGYFDDGIAARISKDLEDSDSLGSIFVQRRDVILMNQRGARAPDRRYQFFGFMVPPSALDKPYSTEAYSESLRKGAETAIDHWVNRGVDVAGYDIMNMVEDIDELREALGHEKILLRGSSFGSQWSFSYMQAHPERVDRAVLGGTEPIDYGYDSPSGIWNVFKRVEQRLEAANDADNRLNLPDVSLTEAIKQIVARLEAHPVETRIAHPRTEKEITVKIGVDDFGDQLRSGIAARRESADSLANFPKFIFEILAEDYRFLAAQVAQDRSGFNGASLQSLSIDNSLGISAVREQQLDAEEARAWVGELNLAYKATRNVTKSPVVPDSFRELKTDLPVLLVHGDLDLSTPFENAESAMKTLGNAHLLRIINGTHGAFDRMSGESVEFRGLVKQFLDADFEGGQATVESIGFPSELRLPELKFTTLAEPSLFDIMSQQSSSAQ